MLETTVLKADPRLRLERAVDDDGVLKLQNSQLKIRSTIPVQFLFSALAKQCDSRYGPR